MSEQTVVDGKYRLWGLCSDTGGMGTLYFVTPVGTEGPTMVLKVCKLTDPEMRARFRREVRVMQQFAGNGFVVPILDANLDHDPPYFVMPHYEHGDLARHGAMIRSDLAQLEVVFNRMIDCIAQLHDKKVLHRDIKPQNFLVGNGGGLVVSDFGLCTEAESPTAFTRSTQWAGTFGFMPPEFMNGGFKGGDVTADIFMLGKAFYALASGREPMYLVAEGVPPQLFPIFERCCAIDKASRYQSLTSLKQSLTAAFDAMLGRAVGPGKVYGLLRAISDRLRINQQYLPDEIGQFVEELGMLEPDAQHKVCMELPQEAFALLAQELVSPHLGRFLAIYRGMAEHANYAWSFAEQIAGNMKLIFDTATVPAVYRTECLRSAIIAAIRQNRFAAMGTCAAMIKSVDQEELGQRVHDLLLQHDNYFIQQIEPSECMSTAVRAAIVALKGAADARANQLPTGITF